MRPQLLSSIFNLLYDFPTHLVCLAAMCRLNRPSQTSVYERLEVLRGIEGLKTSGFVFPSLHTVRASSEPRHGIRANSCKERGPRTFLTLSYLLVMRGEAIRSADQPSDDTSCKLTPPNSVPVKTPMQIQSRCKNSVTRPPSVGVY